MRVPRGRGWWILGLVMGWLGLVCLPGRAAAQTCASPIAIPSSGGVFTGTTSGLSQIVLSCTSATANAPEAVYTWTPAVSGTAVVATCGSGFDTVLALETQCGVANSTLAAGCSDDACKCCADCNNQQASWDSRVTTTVTAGVPLFVIVDGYGVNGYGAYRLVVTPPGVSTTTTPVCAATTTTSTTTTTTTSTSTTTTSTTTTSTTTTTAGPTTTTTSTTTSTTTTSTTAPPGTCANPLTIPAAGGTVSGTTSGPSHQTGSCGNTATSPEQVYQWTPSSSGQTTIQTCGAGTAYDTVVYVRSATCTGSEITAGCNDDACANASGLNRASKLTPMVTSGATYFIIVDGYGGAQGAYTISVSTPGAVTTTTTTLTTTTTSTTATTTTTSTTSTTTTSTTTTTTSTTSTTTTTLSGAACVSPTVIPAMGGTFTGSTSGSNTLTTPCDAATGPEKVYQWTPSISGVASLQTCGGATNFDTVLSLRTSPCASGATLANGCNDNLCVCGSTCGNVASKITPTVVAGQTYYAIVDGHAGASGTYTLTVAAPPPPTTTTTSTTAPAASTTTTTLPPLTLTGFVPGIANSSDAVVDGVTHRAYVASKQFGLSVVDVTTPASPVVIGAANPPFYGARVSRIGTRAVVTASGLGLRVVDLTDETHPVTVGTLAGTYSAVVMKDANTAYATALVANVGVFQVVNVGVTPPVVTTSLALTAAGDFKVVGGLAYIPSVISGQAALKIVNPATTPPTLVGQVGGMPNSFALDVAVSGTTAYVAMGFAGIQVVNVSDTAHPTLGTVLGQSASALVTSGTRLYAVDGSLLKLIDISTPGTPTLIGSGAAYAGQRLAVDGATAYLTAGTGVATGLSIQTVSGSAPVLVTNEADSVNYLGVAASGTRAVEAGGNSGMKILSVATPSAPTVGGTYAGFVGCVALSGTTAYAFDALTGLLQVIDVAGSPSLLGSVSIGAGGDMQVVGTTVYVAAGGFGLRVVNAASPSSMTVHTANTPDTAFGVSVLGNYAYVADSTTIQVVDVSDVTNPVIVNSVPTGAKAVSALGSRLYAVDGNKLKILSLTTPSAPAILNAGAVYDGAQGVLADPTRPNVVYLAGTALNHGDTPPGIYEGIVALNVANPAAPVQLGTNLVTPGTVKKLAFANGLIYASDSAGIVDVVTP